MARSRRETDPRDLTRHAEIPVEVEAGHVKVRVVIGWLQQWLLKEIPPNQLSQHPSKLL